MLGDLLESNGDWLPRSSTECRPQGANMTRRVIGIDIGGTKIAAGLVDEQARVLSRYETKQHSDPPPDVVIEAAQCAFQAVLRGTGMRKGDLLGVGVGFAGHTDALRGVVLTSSNLPAWDRMPLREVLSERLGVPVALDNDCNAAALAEHRYGAGRGSRHMVYVVFSTGTGAGIIIDGQLYRGHTGAAGELGHTVVDVDGRTCNCGKRGCLMSWGCGMALTELAGERIRAGEDTLIRDMAGGDLGSINGEMVADAARRGDRVARELIQLTGKYLGVGLSTIVQVLNPEVIVVGGGLTNMGSMLMDPCLQSLRENVHPVLADSARIVSSHFGEDAGIVGAAALVLPDPGSTSATIAATAPGKE
jgi:glucokinase